MFKMDDFKIVQLYFLKNTIKGFIIKLPFFRVMFARRVDWCSDHTYNHIFDHIKTHTNLKLYFLENTILGRRISKSLPPSIYFFKIYEKGVEMGQNDTF